MGPYFAILVTTVSVIFMGAVFGVVAGFVQRRYYSRLDRIDYALPSGDCGVCGFPRCIDYAEAMAEGKADPCACIPGGPQTAHTIADIWEIEATPGETAIAAVHCKGGVEQTSNRAVYEGIPDCQAALLIENGVKSCTEGCIGFGTCVRACPFGALSINENGIAVVDRHRCIGCGACIGVCPRDLISLIPEVHKIFLACNNHDEGRMVSSYCSVGCTACGACVAITPSGAVAMRDRLPHLDYRVPGENFIAAAWSCPPRCFTDLVKARPRANIDTACNGCGECLAICPVPGAVTGTHGKRHVIRKELCIGCGRCLAVCDTHAISLWGSLGYEGVSRKVSQHF